MQFEEFDKRIREAADRHYPAYDEEAWSKMKKLLDQHLPVEKDDNRRILFLFLLFLLIGIGSWVWIRQPWKNDRKEVAGNTPVATHTYPGHIEDRRQVAPVMPSGTQDNLIQMPSGVPVVNNGLSQLFSLTEGSPQASAKSLLENRGTTNPIREQELAPAGEPVVTKEILSSTETTRQDKNIPVTSTTQSIGSQEKSSEEKKREDDQASKKLPDALQQEITESSLNKKETTDRKRKSAALFFTLSAGPDISAAGSGLGTTKIFGGAGIGITINDRFTLRTGFYSGRKVYTADADAYDPPREFWNYYPYLQKVDANCAMYEIPVSASYQFASTAKQHWFAGAGISSYLMKKETYDYYYKYTPTGATVKHEWTAKKKTNHFFSGVTLSGGYQRNLGRSVSLIVEPYVKLPLTGVGYGKVKLNSAGVLFSLGIKPFAGSREK